MITPSQVGCAQFVRKRRAQGVPVRHFRQKTVSGQRPAAVDSLIGR
jgi:hypothetical protein